MKQLFRKLFFFFLLTSGFFLYSINSSLAQHNIRDTIAFPMIGATFGYQLPGGDMADRFGNNFNVGGVFLWKLKNNLIFGFEGDFLFGDDVKENTILNKYKTPDGNIIDEHGHYATVILYERGLKFEFRVGKIFPVIGPNKNSGLMANLGIGYMQHKIRIETPESSIPYISGEYSKGYDRLSTGPSLTEFIGYMNFSNSRLVNFYAGLEFTQAFTKNRREMNFDTGKKDDMSRLDLFFGLRIGWVFPLYKRSADKLYIN
jgi:hypothetical protein